MNNENQISSIDKVLYEIKSRLSIFENMYTYIRIVQPIEKVAYTLKESQLEKEVLVEKCYEFWGGGKDCANCISMSAFNSRQSTLKIEIKDDVIYLIQAFPILMESKLFIVEMIKEIAHEEIIITSGQEDKNIQEYVEEMNTQIVTDELTGLYNRRYLEEHLPTDLYKARINGSSVAIVIADIDYFKQVNDTYGHLTGDCVLKQFAKLVSSSIRSSTDWMVRYGGEEFIIILNNSNKNDTFNIIENIRRKIEKENFQCDGAKINVTCSFGINIVDKQSYDISKIIETADQCLYLAKQNGRNQSVLK
jgi:diguanylate cyclase (GGDEF)-like protein